MTDLTNDTALAAVRTLLTEVIGEDPDREGLVDTPRRVVKALAELCEGYGHNPAVILSTVFDESCDEMVLVKDIPYASLCEHHMLPFTGHVTIGYLPRKGVVGLSKLPRLVQCFARRLQVQERMTKQIANSIFEHLQPRGVGVLVSGVHSCCALRGVRSHNSMVTSCLLGNFRNADVREEFLSLAR